MERRSFIKYTTAGAALMLPALNTLANSSNEKIRFAQAGTGHRGTGFWGTAISTPRSPKSPAAIASRKNS